MSVYFWDTSALIKRYITETGTGWVRKKMAPDAGSTNLISHITLVEVASALARRIREGSIPTRSAQAAQLLIERHTRREYTVISVGDNVIKQAVSLTYQYPLRAYDAIQLSAALVANQRIIQAGLQSLIFISSDQRLGETAAKVGLPIDNPEVHR